MNDLNFLVFPNEGRDPNEPFYKEESLFVRNDNTVNKILIKQLEVRVREGPGKQLGYLRFQ